MKRISVLLGGLVLAAASIPASAGVVYTQSTTPSIYTPGSASETGGNAGNSVSAQAYEDFTLSTNGTFTQINWRGLENNPAAVINSFTITIYSDDFTLGNPGATGTSLYTETIQGSANQTFVGDDNNLNAIFDFSSSIGPFTATAGTTYWISIIADLTGGDYTWASSQDGNGTFITANGTEFDLYGLSGFPVGLAFTLSTPGATPEPSALLMTGTGLLGGIGMLRRKITRS